MVLGALRPRRAWACGAPSEVVAFLASPTDPRIRLLRLPTNRGLGAALNTGLAAARAPLVAYLPGDDLYDPGHLAALLAALADPHRILVWSGVRHQDGGHQPGLPEPALGQRNRAARGKWTNSACLG